MTSALKKYLIMLLLALGALAAAAAPPDLPQFTPIGSREVNFGDALVFTLAATDPQGQPIFYEAANLPVGAALQARSGVFAWTPTIYQLGTYRINFAVWDHLNPRRMVTQSVRVRVVFRKFLSEKGWGVGPQTNKLLFETTNTRALYPDVTRLEIDGAAQSLTRESYPVAAAAALKAEITSYYDINQKSVVILLDGEKQAGTVISDLKSYGKDGKTTALVVSLNLRGLKAGKHTLTIKAANELGVTMQDYTLVSKEGAGP